MFDADSFIADRAKAIDASGIRKVFDLAASVQNPINLSIGQPHFDVPDAAKQAAIDAITAGKNNYTVTQGDADLREKLLADFASEFQREGRWEDPGLLITSGVSGGLLLAMLALVQEGDEVILPDPYFVMYKHLARLAGGKAVYVNTYPDFKMTAERVEPLITDKTKLIVLSSPSNPTGTVTDEDNWRELVELAERRNILLVSDEIYDTFCYRASGSADIDSTGVAPTPAAFSENVLILKGFSKTYAMTGWRLGYAIGPDAIIGQMTKLQQYTFVCAPSMVQQAALVALDLDMSHYVREYAVKRDRVVAKLSPHFELTAPGGAFYAFPKVPTDETGTEFVSRAIARDLLIIPGNVFSEQDTHFRLSYACDDETLEKGLDLLIDLSKG